MKKGVSSLDAFLAILVMLFIVLWLQNFSNLNMSNQQEFGVNIGLKSEAIRVGSTINSFFAADPNSYDYVIVNSSIPIFGNTLYVFLDKPQLYASIFLNTTYNNTAYSSSYPIPTKLKCNGLTYLSYKVTT